MSSVIVPSVDLAPSLPSRVVTVELIDVTEGKNVAGAEIDFFLPGDLHVPVDDVIVQAGKVTLTLDSNGRGRVRLPAYTDSITPADWVIGVKKRWAPHPYFIRVPAGSTAISLADIPAVQSLPQGVVDWMITGASVNVTQGAQWDASLNLINGILQLGLTVPPGAEPWWRGMVALTTADDTTTLAPGIYAAMSNSVAADLGLPGRQQGTLEVRWYGTSGKQQEWTPRFTDDRLPETWYRRYTGTAWTRWYRNLLERDFRAPQSGGGEDLLHSFPDANHRETWLGARASDGGPTEYGEYHLRKRLGITETPSGFIGLGDAAGFYSELRARASDGKVPDDVLHAWGNRGGWGAGGGFAPGDRYINADGNLAPVFPMTTRMIGWGSSSMERASDEFAGAFPDVTFVGEGKGGEWSNHIAARMGAVPALLTVPGGSIPASGPVTVTCSNMPTTASMKPFAGTLAGVRGTLSSTASTFTFTRSEPGTATTVTAGTPFVPEVPGEYRQYVGLLWAGKNNFRVPDQEAKVIADTRAMFEYFSPMVKRVLVLNHFVDTAQAPDSSQAVQVQAVNAALEAEYGDLCFDANGYLLGSDVWADTGITPTSTDLQQQADGLKPASLSSDSGHLNAAAEVAIANKVREHTQMLGWY